MQPAAEQPAQPAQPQPAPAAAAGSAAVPAQPTPDPTASQPAPAQPTGASPAPAEAVPAKPDYLTTASGLRLKVSRPSSSARTAVYDDWVSVHYTGKLESGKVVDTSLQPRLERGRMVVRPFTFRLGQGIVIAGFEEGITGMKVGEKRTLIIPASLAYGALGARDGLIPPNSALIYEVELIGIYRPEPQHAGN